MKIAAVAHFGVLWRSCGSEVVIHELLKAAAAAGHETRMWVTHKDSLHNWRGNDPEVSLDGVRLHRVRNVIVAGGQVKGWRPDIIVTHHDHAAYSIKLAKTFGARSVFLTHNNFAINRRPLKARPDLTVWNSDWVRESLTDQFGSPGDSMTFHPPLTPERHWVSQTGDAHTLVNLNPDKGAHLFYELAAKEPDRKFVGVIGGHGQQIIRHNLPNVEIMGHDPDMRRVWGRTRVLLMPSIQESYGLVAVEAGLNGIPTIAHPTDGLLENLGAGGLFADRDSVSEWQHQLRLLDEVNHFQAASDYAVARANDAMDATRHTLKKWKEWIG